MFALYISLPLGEGGSRVSRKRETDEGKPRHYPHRAPGESRSRIHKKEKPPPFLAAAQHSMGR